MRQRRGSEHPVKSQRAKGRKAPKASIAVPSIAELREQLSALTAELKGVREHQTATADVLKVISRSTFDLQAVLGTLVRSAGGLCQAENVQIFLRDGEVYRLAADNGFSPEYQEYVRQHPIVPGRGTLVARTALEIAPVHLSDALADPEYTYHEGRRLGGYRTMLGIPLVRDENCIGVIVLTRSEVRPFTDKQVELVATFADQAVIAIENTRLFEQVQVRTRDLEESLQQQTATADVLKVISRSAFDLQTVLQTLVESAARLCEADRAAITRQRNGVFYRAESYGFSKEFMEYVKGLAVVPQREDAMGRALLEGKFVHIHDVLADPDYKFADAQRLGHFRIRSVLAVPMLREGLPIGVLALTRAEVRAFTDKQIELVQTFADQAAIAIENARLFNETKEALERQTATADILKVIASSPSDVQPVFDAIATSAKRLIGGFSSTVFRFIDGRAYLEALTPTTPAADEVLRSTFPRPVADFAPFRLAQAGEVMQIPDTEALSDEIKDIARARGFRSMLFAPLMNKGASIGFIAVTRLETGGFADHHVQLLRTFADQAVIAIENARLFDEVQAKTRDLTEALEQQTATADVLKVISRSAFDLPIVLDALLTSACQLCQADIGTIRYQDGTGDYRLAATYGCKPEWIAHFSGYSTKPDRSSVFGQTIVGGHTVHIPDVLVDPDYNRPEAQKLMGFRAALGVPLVREGQTFGVINLFRTAVGSFENRQIELVETFADQAVIAIENARLFDEVRERTRELAKSLDDLRTAQDRLIQTEKLASLGQLTAGIAHEIKNPLNFVNNFSALSAELIDELNDVLTSAAVDDKSRGEIDELTQMLKGNLEKVVQHGKRADSIVKNMLLHSREGSGEHRPADINAILEESLNLAYHGARAERPGFNITIERDLDPNAGLVDVFPQDITRVFLNLISNGFYAATKRKQAEGDGFEPTLSASTRTLGGRVEIRVRDNGAGIPREVREKIFNPFFTTKPAGEGTGLGLSMSHDIIVKQHGGKIDVETEPGEFTEFVITLPRKLPAQADTTGDRS